MKKLMKSVVPVSALLLMLVGCAEDEEDVNVDVNEEEPAILDGEEDVNIIEEDTNSETNSESNTNSEDNNEEESVGTSDNNTEETPDSNAENGEDESNN